MNLLQLYIDRAAECRREATESVLANVRARSLKSAMVWDNMANRAQLAQGFKAANVAGKSAQ